MTPVFDSYWEYITETKRGNAMKARESWWDRKEEDLMRGSRFETFRFASSSSGTHLLGNCSDETQLQFVHYYYSLLATSGWIKLVKALFWTLCPLSPHFILFISFSTPFLQFRTKARKGKPQHPMVFDMFELCSVAVLMAACEFDDTRFINVSLLTIISSGPCLMNFDSMEGF